MLILEVSNLAFFGYLRVQDKVDTLPFFLFLCFENDLTNLFCACIYGFRINRLSVCCPTVADDMALISLTKYGQHMLQIFAIMTEYIMLLNVRFWYSMNQALPSHASVDSVIWGLMRCLKGPHTFT